MWSHTILTDVHFAYPDDCEVFMDTYNITSMLEYNSVLDSAIDEYVCCYTSAYTFVYTASTTIEVSCYDPHRTIGAWVLIIIIFIPLILLRVCKRNIH
jgi:hypothetical protein